MKVFEFTTAEFYYAFSGKDFDRAKELFDENLGDEEIVSSREIPESEWDEKKIAIHEDNNTSKKPFYVSIRQELSDYPSFIYTNDYSFIE